MAYIEMNGYKVCFSSMKELKQFLDTDTEHPRIRAAHQRRVKKTVNSGVRYPRQNKVWNPHEIGALKILLEKHPKYVPPRVITSTAKAVGRNRNAISQKLYDLRRQK